MTVESDALLSAPLSSTVRAEIRLNRNNSTYANCSEKFLLPDRGYHKQYFETYFRRLDTLRSLIIKQAKEALGEKIPIIKLSELREEDHDQRTEDILVVGTVFKQQVNKPSILKEIGESQEMEDGSLEIRKQETNHYTAETDHLILEDETMRVRLVGKLEAGQFVNGVIMGCWGREASGGCFKVSEAFFPQIPVLKEETPEDVSICVLSGLELGGDSGDCLESIQLAVDWVCGGAGGLADQEQAVQLDRLILAGDSLAESTRDRAGQTTARYLTKNKQASSVQGVRELDDLLVQLSGSISVDLMPGENDPATGLLPQQPLHKCMFPQARVFPTFQTVTNPYCCTVGNRRLVILSGETIRDIARNSAITDTLHIMEKCLQWGHLAPTCPDTIGCFPYYEQDPFVIDALPDFFIVGNQSKFQQKTVEIRGKRILLVAVPRFSHSQTLVRLGMKELTCDLLEFAISLNSSPESPVPNK